MSKVEGGPIDPLPPSRLLVTISRAMKLDENSLSFPCDVP